MNDKTKLKQRLSAALPFAHLLGLGPAAAAVDDDTGDGDDTKQRDGESDDEYAKRMEEGDRKQRDDESDEDYAKRMEEVDAADGDDQETDKEQAARVNERARCAAIFGAAAAGARPDVAAHLAFSTDMAAADAIKMLNSFAGGGPLAQRSLSSRMASVNIQNPGAVVAPAAAAPSGNSAVAVAAQIIAAGKKRRGEK